MFPTKAITVFLLLSGSVLCYGQYDGVNGDSSTENTGRDTRSLRDIQSDSLYDDYDTKPSITDVLSLYKAVEVMTNGNQNFLYLSLDPQVGISLNERLIVGGGVHFGLNNLSGTVGAFAFSRICIKQIFIQGEYRAVNGRSSTFGNIPPFSRDWTNTPIFMIGYAFGGSLNSWTSVGLATNGNYSRNMPFGPLIFRYGLRF